MLDKPNIRQTRGPLSEPVFRRIWLASLVGNFALLMQGVGAAWLMTELTSSPRLVAMVQTAVMVPVMLLALPAGAAADMYDRRRIVIAAISVCCSVAVILTLLTAGGHVTPAILLTACFVTGCGIAVFTPAWQASVSEQVSAPVLPSAMALNSISYSLARSIGPALGGAVVALAGSLIAFGTTALLCLPLLAVFLGWRRKVEPSRLPPERLGWAVGAGMRYILHSPPVRTVIARTLLIGVAGGSLGGLMPLIARDQLGGGPELYGVMLALTGLGAVIGAFSSSGLRKRFSSEQLVWAGIAIEGLSYVVIACSRTMMLVGPILVVAGTAWMVAVTVLNIGVQVAVPRWVSGRILAVYQAMLAGGVGLGSSLWGSIAAETSLSSAMLWSAAALFATALAGTWLPMPREERVEEGRGLPNEPDVALALTGRSGPVSIEVEYRVDPANARQFYTRMQDVRLLRKRLGAYAWSVSRDVSAPELWVERFQYPTWADYLRQRNRQTVAEEAFEKAIQEQLVEGGSIKVRRWLERPFGSVRWRDETPDPGRNAGEV